MDILRLTSIKDSVYAEGGFRAQTPVTRVAACAVIANPLAGIAKEDLQELVLFGSELGELLATEALKHPTGPSQSKENKDLEKKVGQLGRIGLHRLFWNCPTVKAVVVAESKPVGACGV